MSEEDLQNSIEYGMTEAAAVYKIARSMGSHKQKKSIGCLALDAVLTALRQDSEAGTLPNINVEIAAMAVITAMAQERINSPYQLN
jgi:hypothetical protein